MLVAKQRKLVPPPPPPPQHHVLAEIYKVLLHACPLNVHLVKLKTGIYKIVLHVTHLVAQDGCNCPLL